MTQNGMTWNTGGPSSQCEELLFFLNLERSGFKYCIAGGFFQKSINVTPTPVKMVEHAKNKEALTNANVPQSFKEVTVQKVRIV